MNTFLFSHHSLNTVIILTTNLILLFTLSACGPPPHIGHDYGDSDLYFIDAHTQLSIEVEPDVVLDRMAQHNVKLSILAARGGRSSSSIVKFAIANPEQIYAAIKTKGNDYANNTPAYYDKLAQRANSGKYKAIGEVMIYHAEKGPDIPEVDVALTDDRVSAAVDVARNNHWPLILHIEFAALDEARQQAMRRDLGKFLRNHPNLNIVLIHMAQLSARDVGLLVMRHSNVYFMTSHTNPAVIENSNQPWTNLFRGNRLAPRWRELFIHFPRRFIFALDNVMPAHWEADMYRDQMRYWRNALAALPDDVAKAVAHENAEQLWRIE